MKLELVERNFRKRVERSDLIVIYYKNDNKGLNLTTLCLRTKTK